MGWEHNQHKGLNPIDSRINEFLKQPYSYWLLIVGTLFVIGIYSSIYTVQTDEEAVITRFGKYHTTTGEGLQFKLPFGIDLAHKVRTTVIHEEGFGFLLSGPQGPNKTKGFLVGHRSANLKRNTQEEALMLTGDLNVADVQWVVQYRIDNPRNYLFNVRDAQKNIRDISQATMRRVVGDRTVNDVLTVGRVDIAAQAKRLTHDILNQYEMGVMIIDVKLQDVNPPERVKPSFNEVVAAKQQQEQAINEAEREYNSIIPEARGKADQEISRAKGYAKAVINRARGDAEKFKKVLEAYRKAPEVTKLRLYLELVEDVLTRIQRFTVVDPEVKGVLPVFDSSSMLNRQAANKE